MIDLSSDTATKPTEAMREAILKAPVGDEQRLEDPTVLKLIDAVCERLGKPAGLYLPSGTMCNLISVKTHTRMGDAVFLGNNCHVLRCETGAAAAVSGVILDTVECENGIFDGEQLEAAFYEQNPYTPRPSLVCVEQSHNFAGGAIWPLEKLQSVQEVAKKHKLQVHMDGARLFNASVASGVSAATYAQTCDSVWVDFTKGLGAPLGSVLCGSEEFIAEARRYKHMFGGAMRQAGMMAAGCLFALEHHVERLAEDHRRARELADFLGTLPGFEMFPVDTNLIFFRPGDFDASDFLEQLESRGLRMSRVGPLARAVTHLDIDDEDLAESKRILSEVCG